MSCFCTDLILLVRSLGIDMHEAKYQESILNIQEDPFRMIGEGLCTSPNGFRVRGFCFPEFPC